MTVLDDEQSLERKAKDHNSQTALLSKNEAPSLKNNERNGIRSYSKEHFLLRERNLLHFNQMLTRKKCLLFKLVSWEIIEIIELESYRVF